jgi:hypothetical protein
MTPDDPRQHRPDPPGPGAPESSGPGAPGPAGSPRNADGTTPDRPTSNPPHPDPTTPDRPADNPPHPDPTTPDGPSGRSAPAGRTPPPPVDVPTTVDDLASALVDGLLPADAAASARARPEVMARVAQLEAGRATLRQVPAPDPAARDRAVAAALAAFDDAAAPGSSSPGRSPWSADGSVPSARPGTGAGQPVDLAAHRHAGPQDAHRAGTRRAPRWLGAAAAVVAVVMGLVGLAAVSSSGGDEDTDTAADFGTAQEEADDGAGSSQDSAEAPSAAPESGGGGDAERSAAVEVGDLGVFASGDALVDHLAGRLGEAGADAEIQPDSTASAEADQRATDAFDSCAGAPPPPLDDPDGALRLHGRALVDGDAVNVWVVDTPQGRRAVALDDACGVVVDRPLG